MRPLLHLPAAAALLLVLLALSVPAPSQAYNVTKILAQFPQFSTFNHYLTATRLATEINRRLTLTVLAVDNAAMAPLLAKGLPLYTLRNVLSLHILVDYYGAKKLHQLTGGSTLSSSMYQATGTAIGTSGYINITDHHLGRVSFAAQDSDTAAPAFFVKSIKEIPYNISIIEVSDIISSSEAEAPTPAPPAANLTEIMNKKGCKLFAALLANASDVEKTFDAAVAGGLTVFCPLDAAVKGFMEKFKNLTAEGKTTLLLYHGYPVYSSLQTLKSNNGPVTTLATDASAKGKGYEYTVQNQGEVVTLKTKVVTATITATAIDQDPLAVYTIDKVLQPPELYKVVEAPAPAPAAEAPKADKISSPPAPAGPEESPADLKAADHNVAGRVAGKWVTAAVAALVAGVAVLV